METKTYFYYVRDERKAPVVTVCLKINDTEVARGVAFVNTAAGDNPCKKIGRQIAEGRATRALVRKATLDPIHYFDCTVDEGDDFHNKCVYNPKTVHPLEQKLINNARGIEPEQEEI